MKDKNKTKDQLINELAVLRQRITEVETSEAQRKQVEEGTLNQSAVSDAINKVLLETLTCETDVEVAHTSLAVAEELTGSKFGFIGEVNQAGHFDTIALSDPGWDACRMPRTDAVVMIKDMEIRGIWGRVLKDEQSLIVNDPASYPYHVGTPEGHPPLTSFLGVPLKQGGRTIGMIGLANKKSRYDLADQEAVETLSVAFVETLMRKRMEEALKESEEKYRRIFETSKDAIFLTSKEGKVIDVNEAGVDLFGYSKDELLKIDLAKHLYINPDDRKKFQKMIEKKGFVKDYEVEFKKKDKTKIYISITASVRKDSSGNIEGYEEIIRDITYQRQTEEEAKRYAGKIEKISKAVHLISSSLEIQQVLRHIVRLAREVTGADSTSVVLVDEGGHATSSIEDFHGIPPLHVRARPHGMTQKILATGRPLVIDDQKMTKGIKLNPPLVEVGIRSCAGAPLVVRGKTLGVLFVHSRVHTLRDKIKLLETFAGDAAIALENARLYEEGKRLYKETKELADKDALTDLYNHRRINELLENEIERSKRGGDVFSIMMLDVDDLKLINDAHGHIVGDKLLKEVATILKKSSRSVDSIGRYGGDEFLIILPYTDGEKAKTIAKRISRKIHKEGLKINEEITIPIRLSIGVATYPFDSSLSQDLISLADKSMYDSKRFGRSVVSASVVEVSEFLTKESPSLDVLQGLVAAVNSKDHYTKRHPDLVTNYALSLGKKANLPSEEMEALRIAGLLHDIGKIGIPDTILRKPGPLEKKEFEIVKQHPRLGATMLDGPLPPHREHVLGAIMHHHERYDGKGYPGKLKGKDIPFLARIIGIADAYCAMITDRPYRKALTKDEAIDELKKKAGTQFDPDLVSEFIECLKESKF